MGTPGRDREPDRELADWAAGGRSDMYGLHVRSKVTVPPSSQRLQGLGTAGQDFGDRPCPGQVFNQNKDFRTDLVPNPCPTSRVDPEIGCARNVSACRYYNPQ